MQCDAVSSFSIRKNIRPLHAKARDYKAERAFEIVTPPSPNCCSKTDVAKGTVICLGNPEEIEIRAVRWENDRKPKKFLTKECVRAVAGRPALSDLIRTVPAAAAKMNGLPLRMSHLCPMAKHAPVPGPRPRWPSHWQMSPGVSRYRPARCRTQFNNCRLIKRILSPCRCPLPLDVDAPHRPDTRCVPLTASRLR
jgi:hypothetical protein